MHKIIDATEKMKNQVTNLIYVLQELEKILSTKIIEMNKLNNQEISILDGINKYGLISSILEKIKDKDGNFLQREIIKVISDEFTYNS